MSRREKNARYTTKHLLNKGSYVPSEVKECSDILYRNFSRQIGLLLESKRPRTQHTFRGRLDTRRAYRTPFTDIVFKQSLANPSSDTTIVMLIDGSGSMTCSIELFGKHMTRLDGCNAVCSAFSRAVNDVLGNKLKVEVMVKSSPDIISDGMGCKDGAFVSLTRVFTNTSQQKQDPKDLLKVKAYSPVEVEGEDWGSTTAEFSVMPALVEWMKKNVQTKNIVVFNLTDGEAYATLGQSGFTFRNYENKQMRIKYMRGLPNLTLLIGRELKRETAEEVYGQNIVKADGDEFVNKMFQILLKEVGATL